MILRKKADTRKDSDIQVLLPFLKQIKFFQDKPDIKEVDLIFLCDRAKYEHFNSSRVVFSHGKYISISKIFWWPISYNNDLYRWLRGQVLHFDRGLGFSPCSQEKREAFWRGQKQKEWK